MTSDILTKLDLDKNESSKVIIIKELNGCDSTFITSCAIAQCIKNNNALLILTNHNCVLHYHNIGLKMNYNLQKALVSGLINVYDVGDEIVNNILENKCISQQKILYNIKDRLKLIHEKYDKVNIIIDGLSHFFDLQLTLREVNQLCDEVIKIVQSNNSFLIIHCNVAADHDITEVMANLLCHKAQTVMEVESLTSGLSSDISGRLTIKRPGLRFQTDNMYIMQQRPSQYLFKLFDRGVKLLAPGTIY